MSRTHTHLITAIKCGEDTIRSRNWATHGSICLRRYSNTAHTRAQHAVVVDEPDFAYSKVGKYCPNLGARIPDRSQSDGATHRSIGSTTPTSSQPPSVEKTSYRAALGQLGPTDPFASRLTACPTCTTVGREIPTTPCPPPTHHDCYARQDHTFARVCTESRAWPAWPHGPVRIATLHALCIHASKQIRWHLC